MPIMKQKVLSFRNFYREEVFENEYYIYSLFPSPINSEFLVIVGDKDRNSEENQFVIYSNVLHITFESKKYLSRPNCQRLTILARNLQLMSLTLITIQLYFWRKTFLDSGSKAMWAWLRSIGGRIRWKLSERVSFGKLFFWKVYFRFCNIKF